ncbi:MAG: cytochrome-c peroxidase [Bacteroidetes bacterium]|nr:cytochrome-c peroxidase [Bacteroidota bacterium]
MQKSNQAGKNSDPVTIKPFPVEICILAVQFYPLQKTVVTIFFLFLAFITLSYLLGSCRKEQKTNGLQLLQQEVPAGFPSPAYTFHDNPLTQEGFELGRKLFYDNRLSIDGSISCASCHQQIAGFGTFEHDRSHGVFDSHTLRNASVLFNLAWNKAFHWDGEFGKLQDAVAQPINGHIEMGETFQGVIAKLERDDEYRKAFKNVFGSPFIRPEYILKALSQFTGYLVSANSKYDKVKRGEAGFTTQELNGYNIYKASCATCHPEPLFTDYSYRNIGLPVDNFLDDFGRMRITGKKEDSLKFKVPTLRNCNISSNYMHDGRFNTLQQCINHYRNGVQQSATLDPLLANGITLTNAEINDLFQFLKTLTDSTFLRDTRFQHPQ